MSETHHARQMLTADRFRAVFDCSPDCIKLVGPDGRLFDINAAGLRMIEAASIDAVRGRSIFELIDPAFHDRFRAGMSAVFAGAVTQMQFEVIGLGGRRLLMDQSAAPLFAGEPQRVVEMIAITRDVTQARRTEADLLEARLSHEISRSAANVAASLGQDLKAPLERIIGYSEMLLEALAAQKRRCLVGLHSLANERFEVNSGPGNHHLPNSMRLSQTRFRPCGEEGLGGAF